MLNNRFWFFFGAIDNQQLRLSSLEKKAVNDMFVILSDVWLDNPEVLLFYISSWLCITIIIESYSKDVYMCYLVEKTMEKLAIVLDGYDSVEVVPSLFVLMGNFCSRPCNLAFNSFEELRYDFLFH